MLQQLTSIDFGDLFTTVTIVCHPGHQFAALDYLVKPFTATACSSHRPVRTGQQQKQPMKQFEALFHKPEIVPNELKEDRFASLPGLRSFGKDIIHARPR